MSRTRWLQAVAAGAVLLVLVLWTRAGSGVADVRATAEELGPFITGTELMRMAPADVRAKWGFKIVHQSWKTHAPTGAMAEYFRGWHRHNPDALHVLWTDSEDVELVTRHYPEYVALYNALPVYNQRFDLSRLLYLHRYGGLYVDLDYEARAPFFASLGTALNDNDAFVVQSPILLNEVMQNSLMFARVQDYSYFREVVHSIQDISAYVHGPNSAVVWFRNPITRRFVNIVFSVFISGPSVLDKTYVRGVAEHKWRIKLLDMTYFAGPIAKHHHFTGWAGWNVVSSLVPPVLFALGVEAAVALLVFATVRYALRAVKGAR